MSVITTGRRRLLATLALLATAVLTLAACTNTPPPPLVPRAPGQPPAPPPKTQPKPTELVVGVNSLHGGYNPHALADVSPATTALSDLTLPSAFNPGPDGSPQLNHTLLDHAAVTNTAPFTVSYRLNRDAGWSDGAPIAAEDFVYLWQQMRSQPGTTNPAGYRLISNVQSRQGGKTVEVTFRQPYPGWKTLFRHLLPAHLLKDAPGGWAHGMDNGYPASGGPFSIMQADRGRGEIVLERNDRYWGRPPSVDHLVLRAADGPSVASALRTGDDQLGVLDANANTMRALHELGPEVSTRTLPRPVTTQLQLRTSGSRLQDQRVRAAVIAALNRKDLIAAGTHGGPSAQRGVHSQVLAPSEPGYHPTAPPGTEADTPNLDRVGTLLTEAGYQRSGNVWQKDGTPLNLVLAAPSDNEEYQRIAEHTHRQLQAAGIQSRVVTPDDADLYGPMLHNRGDSAAQQDPDVDVAVVPRPTGGDPATRLADEYGCAGYNSDADSAQPGNVGGFCDPALQPSIEAALTGRVPFSQADNLVERELWKQAVSVPLYQESQVLAVHKDTTGVRPGVGFARPFLSAPDWNSPDAKKHKPGKSSSG